MDEEYLEFGGLNKKKETETVKLRNFKHENLDFKALKSIEFH